MQSSRLRFPAKKLSLSLKFSTIFYMALLCGCAGENAYRAGTQAMQQGNYQLALAKMKEATELEPNSVQYRSGLLRSREEAINRLLAAAELAKSQNDFPTAHNRYQQILYIAPENEDVRQKEFLLTQFERHLRLLAEAKNAFSAQETERAKDLVQQVLSENPLNQKALDLRASFSFKSAKPTANAILSLAYRKPVTLELEDASLRQIFSLLSRASGLNFVFDREVKMDQRSSVLLKNSTIEAALYYTLLTNQLESQVLDNNTILIYPNSPSKQKDYQELILRTFHLSHADAKNVANYLRTFVKSKDISLDEKLNLVTIRDTPEAISIAEKLVALQDVPEPEVMLEVEVLEVDRTRLLQLGINWPESVSLIPIPSSSYGLTARDLLHNLNPSTITASIGPTTIKAQKQDTDASILANPRIRVRNREKAKVMVGERVPNVTTTATATGLVSESINYIDVGLKLDVEPTISLDNDVAIRIGLEVSSIVTQLQTKAGTTAFQLGTRNASTMLSLKDGETQILAGLINDQDRSDASKIPALGDLPIVGRLFGSKTDNGQRTEIILSITPHLIRNVQRPSSDMASIRSGTEGSFRLRPDVPHINSSSGGDGNSSSPIQTFTSQDGTNGVKWSGATSVSPDETVALNLSMRAQSPIKKVVMRVDYDPQRLLLSNVAEADFMRQGGAKTRFDSSLQEPGILQVTVERENTTTASADGSIVEFKWKPLGRGATTQILLKSMQAELENGQVQQFPLPQPFTLSIR